MAAAGPDWQTDAHTQLRWMVEDYFGTGPQAAYPDACAADAHERAHGWY